VRQSALVAALRLVGRLAVVLGELPAFPELFGAAGRALAALGQVSYLHKVRKKAEIIPQPPQNLQEAFVNPSFARQ